MSGKTTTAFDLRDGVKNPGPGAYDSLANYKNRSPSYKMGTGPRIQSASNLGNPAPGNYEPKDEFVLEGSA